MINEKDKLKKEYEGKAASLKMDRKISYENYLADKYKYSMFKYLWSKLLRLGINCGIVIAAILILSTIGIKSNIFFTVSLISIFLAFFPLYQAIYDFGLFALLHDFFYPAFVVIYVVVFFICRASGIRYFTLLTKDDLIKRGVFLLFGFLFFAIINFLKNHLSFLPDSSLKEFRLTPWAAKHYLKNQYKDINNELKEIKKEIKNGELTS